MDTRTGEIVDASEVIKLPPSERKHFVEIPPHLVEALKRSTRKERRAWFFDNRKVLGLKKFSEYTENMQRLDEKNNPTIEIPKAEYEKLKEDSWKYKELCK